MDFSEILWRGGLWAKEEIMLDFEIYPIPMQIQDFLVFVNIARQGNFLGFFWLVIYQKVIDAFQ